MNKTDYDNIDIVVIDMLNPFISFVTVALQTCQ